MTNKLIKCRQRLSLAPVACIALLLTLPLICGATTSPYVTTEEDVPLNQATDDNIQGMLPDASHSPIEGSLTALTDATSPISPTANVIPGPDNTIVTMTWDLGGSLEEIGIRRLERIEIWIAGFDPWRNGYDGEWAISHDGENFALIEESRHQDRLTYTGNPIDGWPETNEGTGTSRPNLVRYDFPSELTDGGFRYLRFISHGMDNMDQDPYIRQPRIVEIDVFLTEGPLVRDPSQMPFTYDFGTVRLIEVLPQTRGQFALGSAAAGAAFYVDAQHTIVSLPGALEGNVMIRTARAEAAWLATGADDPGEVSWNFVPAIPDQDADGNPLPGTNTTFADGSGPIDPANNATRSDVWSWRPGFGNQGILHSLGPDSNIPPADTRELVTTIVGLEPFQQAAISAVFGSPATSAQVWGLRGGLRYANDERTNPWFDENSPEVVRLDSLEWASPPSLFTEGDRIHRAAFIGNAVADENGEIQVFVHDFPTPNAALRTWYDGVAYGDRIIRESGAYLAFEVDRDMMLYIVNAPPAEPEWLTANYTKTAMTVETTAGTFDVWERPVVAREQVALPGRSGALGENNYWVVLGEGPGAIAESGDDHLVPDPLLDWERDKHAWSQETDPGAALHTASLTTAVANVDPESGFRLDTRVRVPLLQEAGDNACGFLLLGDGDDFIRAEWLPRRQDGSSAIRFVNTSTGAVLAEEAWTGKTPGRVDNDVGLLDGTEDHFEAGVRYLEGESFFFDDFEDAAASTAAWSSGGTNNLWEVGEPTSGPGSVSPGSPQVGTNVFATDPAGSFQANTNAWLRSPVIDLTGVEAATLSYWEYLDIDDDDLFHHATVSVLDAGDFSEIAQLSRRSGQSGGWRLRHHSLPEGALGREVVIEFRLVTDDFVAVDGWFIDAAGVSAASDFEIVRMPRKLAPDGTMAGIRTGLEPDSASDTHLQFTVEDRSAGAGNEGVTVYVAWDVRASGLEPNWLRENFTRTDHFVDVTSDAGQHRLWAREYASGEQVTLGGASADGGGPLPAGTQNYFVLLGDTRPGLDSFYALAAEGIRENGTWNLSFTLSDANGTSATVATNLTEGLDDRNEFGVFARHPDAGGASVSHPPAWETFFLSMDFLDLPGFLTFDAWRQQHFTPQQLDDPSVSGLDAAPAGDGVANLVKYALDLLPWTPVSSQDLPQADIDEDGRLILVYWERTDIADIDYVPEVSQTLEIWDSGPEHVTEIFRESVEPNIEEVGVRAELPSGAARGFIRLDVQEKQQ